MPEQTHTEMNIWAGTFLGYAKISYPETGNTDWQSPDRDDGYYEMGLPDFVHDLGACAPLLMRMGARFYWNVVRKCWTCHIGGGYADSGMLRFFSPKPEPGGCIILAAQYVFPDGEECDDQSDD